MSIISAIRLQEDEKVKLVVRRFVLVHFPRMLMATVVVGLPFFLMVPLFHLPGRWFGPTLFVCIFLVGLYLLARLFALWYWNALVITDRRIIDIDQRGLFDRVVSEAAYDKVQDVSYRVRGIVGTIFNYGALLVQTAGATATLELDGVRHPKEVHHVISQAMSEFSAREEDPRSERVNTLLNAAAELTPAEAKAFLVELQSAVTKTDVSSVGGVFDAPSHVDEDAVAAMMDESE